MKTKFRKVSVEEQGKGIVPKFFNILGQVYNVLIRPIEQTTNSGKEAGGLCDAKGMILIHPECVFELSKSNRILIHEFIHGVLYRCELDALITDEMNEQITSQITTALLENWDVLPKKYLGRQRLPRQRKIEPQS